MPKLLTTRKQKWVKQFKPQLLKGKPLNPNAASAARFEASLRRLMLKMTAETERAIKKLYDTPKVEAYFAQDAGVADAAQTMFAALLTRFDALFGLKAMLLAETVAEEADSSSAIAIQTSLSELSGGLTLKTDILTGELKEIVSATIGENVGLIKSIPTEYLARIRTAVMQSITTGQGLHELVPKVQEIGGVTIKRARLIANDQTKKAFANINRSRLQKLGVKKFEWLHSNGGQHPRKLHKDLSGKVFSFDDLPIIDERTGERGIPGQLINCRCRMLPVITFDEPTE